MDIKPPQHNHKPPVEHPVSQPAAAQPEPQKPKRRGGGIMAAISTILLVLTAPLIAFGIAAFGLQSYQVDGSSMESTLQNHDRLIVDKFPRTWARITHHDYVPKRGDIIVFNQSGLFDASGLAEKQLIKRVIGLPGDRVVVKDGRYTVYNSQHPNGFNPDTAGTYTITQPTYPTGDYNDVTLGPNQIFVSGDNRGNSEDSRAFGPVNTDRIVGQLILRIVPLNKTERF